MTAEQFDIQTVVVGAGVVGLACAAALAKSGREVLVVERNQGIGQEVSSRNSEVIHAGIYYPTGSLKAKLCVEGRKKLVRYCMDHAIPMRGLGKLIVATASEEMNALRQLLKTGLSNGVDDLVLISTEQALAMEPELNCVGALWSPSTGIVDSHGLMLSLQGELEDNDGMISFGSYVESIDTLTGSTLSVKSVDDPNQCHQIHANEVVNCAGLDAVGLSHRTSGMESTTLPEAFFSKGNYFKLQGKSPFSTLIYPAPVPGGLGTHLVLDIEGNARFGPDVEDAEHANVDMEVNPARSDSFFASIRRYWPNIDRYRLIPDYAGLRPKTSSKGSNLNDFIILDQSDHGAVGLVHCLGIESPGLTASLAIADEVVRRLSLR
ncbi:MAG: NAD(P)/FAD-dependent oxidoreductase [Granulosicoccus sp.]|nr:NAD(P)/FAD-dependent oxidoreductase [Granulosicoccus sp.]